MKQHNYQDNTKFYDGNLGINDAFEDCVSSWRGWSVRLEWYRSPNGKSLIFADYSIRDGRLHRKLFHPLTLGIMVEFRDGDDTCKVYLGSHRDYPEFSELFAKYELETRSPLNKRELINLIKKVIRSYKKDIVDFHIKNYGKPIHKDYQINPKDYSYFEKYLNEFYKIERPILKNKNESMQSLAHKIQSLAREIAHK